MGRHKRAMVAGKVNAPKKIGRPKLYEHGFRVRFTADQMAWILVQSGTSGKPLAEVVRKAVNKSIKKQKARRP